VPHHQCCKRILIIVDCESAQQLLVVALAGVGDVLKPTHMVENGVQGIVGHKTRLAKKE
jgi:hypothetical protein